MTFDHHHPATPTWMIMPSTPFSSPTPASPVRPSDWLRDRSTATSRTDGRGRSFRRDTNQPTSRCEEEIENSVKNAHARGNQAANPSSGGEAAGLAEESCVDPGWCFRGPW
jgi:hypothetical protein